MHPLLVFTARYGPQIAGWLLAHQDELGGLYDGLRGAVTDALAGRGAADRIGPALVGVRDGQTRVLGLLHRHTTRLDGLADAIGQVWAGQQAVGRSLDLLTALSAVELGVSALSHAVLAVQLTAINRRLNLLADEVREVRHCSSSTSRPG